MDTDRLCPSKRSEWGYKRIPKYNRDIISLYEIDRWGTLDCDANSYILTLALGLLARCDLLLAVRLLLLLFESLHDSRPMLGAGSSSEVELFQVFMGTRLWQDGADQQVFHGLFIPTFTRCLSILVESPFLHKDLASSSPCSEAI